LVTGGISGNDIAGPVGIVGQISSGYQDSIQYGIKSVIATVSFYIVLLSANLGVMNLLPIPALDGGRIVFIAIEAIRGKPVDPNKEGFIHFVGYVLLMILMVLILFNDIFKAAFS
jgi:regulator of sigma E protease